METNLGYACEDYLDQVIEVGGSTLNVGTTIPVLGFRLCKKERASCFLTADTVTSGAAAVLACCHGAGFVLQLPSEVTCCFGVLPFAFAGASDAIRTSYSLGKCYFKSLARVFTGSCCVLVMIHVPLSHPMFWDYRHVPPCSFLWVLKIKLDDLNSSAVSACFYK